MRIETVILSSEGDIDAGVEYIVTDSHGLVMRYTVSLWGHHRTLLSSRVCAPAGQINWGLVRHVVVCRYFMLLEMRYGVLRHHKCRLLVYYF